MTDLVTFGEATLRLSPPLGARLETAGEFAADVWGPESNAAVAAAAVGVDAVWLSKLPDTPTGRRVVRTLRGHGVRTGVAWSEAGRLSTAFVERGGDRGAHTVPDRADAAVTTATPAELPLEAAADAGTVFVSGATATRSETLLETTAALFDAAADAGATRAFDTRFDATDLDPETARTQYERLLGRVDTLVVDESNVRRVFDLDGEMIPVGNHLRTAYDLSTVVITRTDARNPTVGLHRDTVTKVPSVEATTRDPAGVHDAFVGGFLAGRLDGKAVDAALRDGAAAAALARTIVGDVVVGSPADVAAFREE